MSRGREEGRDGGREAGSEGGRLGWCLVYLGRVHEEEESGESRKGGTEGGRQGVREGGWDGALCIWDVSTRKRKAVS